MQSEKFDKKIKEAADHHHPPYDEKAWEKMEKLLDKHLPQKKDERRRYIFFLLLFLLTGGGIYLMIDKPWQSNKPLVVSDQKNPQNISVNSIKPADNGNAEKINNKNTVDITKSPMSGKAVKLEQKKQQNISAINKELQIKKPKEAVTNDPFSLREKDERVNPLKDNEAAQNNITRINSAAPINKDSTNNNIVNSASEKTVPNKSSDNQKLNTGIGMDSSQKNINASASVVKTKPKNKKSNSFFLSLSAGPDISFAGLDELGKMKLLAGGGIGYTFKNKFTLRTGFYTARKIYSAQPYQYHTSGSQWVGNYKLEQVDADCRVYEIPVLLSYNFSHSAKQNWLATTGISSYLMKRETYNYQYKNSTGQVYTHKWTLRDKNKHYFSVLTLSGGYQRNINNTFSIMAEPYMKIPLSGVGYGKVKLNSAGILVSVGIKLFGSDKSRVSN
jgi:hypothetical protein